MNKITKSGLILLSILCMPAAFAGNSDAVVSVRGKALPDISLVQCTIGTETNVVNLGETHASDLPYQDAVVTHSEATLTLKLHGPGCHPDSSTPDIFFTFSGEADDQMGTVLANTSTGDQAASSVGIGIYDFIKAKQLAINKDHLPIPASSKGVQISFLMVKLRGGKTPVAGNVSASLTIGVERL